MSKRLLAVALGVTLLLIGCSDTQQSGEPVGPDGSRAASLVRAPAGEREALDELTRIVALALQDAGVRHRVKEDMRNSRYTVEHKLPFRDYLHGRSGGILLAKMVKESGRSREEIEALLGQVRPLEFYMPVPQHRENWRGGADLLVASLMDDDTAPTAFTLQGEPVAVRADVAPATPTLAIVPVETDFSRELDPAKFRNRNDQGGLTIGTYVVCDPEFLDCGGGGGGGGTAPKPGGLYMTYSNLSDDGEPWTKGSPEIEVHVHGPNGGDKTYGADLACSGEHVTEPYRNFDQNDNTWSGEVLLFTQQQIESYNANYGGQGFNVMVWEDDDTACTIKTDKNMTEVLKAIAAVAGAAAVAVQKPTSVGDWIKVAGAFIGALYASANWLLSNDDFLGDAPQVTTNATRTDLWLDGSHRNGYIYTQLRYMQ